MIDKLRSRASIKSLRRYEPKAMICTKTMIVEMVYSTKQKHEAMNQYSALGSLEQEHMFIECTI